MAEDTTPDAEQLSTVYVEDIVNDRDYSKVPDVFSESITMVEPFAEIQGRDEFETWLRGFEEVFPDYHVTIHELVASSEVSMIEWTLTGTHEGELDGIPPTGREVEFKGMTKLQIGDKKFHEYRIYYDSQEILAQLGVADE